MEKIYNVTEFAEMIGKSVKTLQRWDREGILVAYRSPSKRRYYTHAQYLEYTGERKEFDAADVVYIRAFSQKQADYMEEQIDLLKAYTIKEGIPISTVYTDFGSALDFNRPNWNKLIADCFDGKIKSIYVTEKDRFAIFGYEWISNLLETYCNVKIIPLRRESLGSKAEAKLEFLKLVEVYAEKLEKLNKMKYKIREKILKDE